MRRTVPRLSKPSRIHFEPTVKQLLNSPTISPENDGQTTTITGYLKSIRRQKTASFATITDGSTPGGIQALFFNDSTTGTTKGLSTGSAVRLTGKLQDAPNRIPNKELIVSEGGAEFLGGGGDDYPIQKKAHSEEFLRDWVHLRARTDTFASVLRLRHRVQSSLNLFFDDQQFIHVHAPILTGNDAEGAGETFKLAPVPLRGGGTEDFFSPAASLTVSAQLHLEAMTQSLGRTWVLGPCFRAERSATRRHLAEFWMLEAEWILLSGVHEVMDFTETLIRSVVENTFRLSAEDLAATSSSAHLDAVQSHVNPECLWERVSYTDAISLLQNSSETFDFPITWGSPLQTEHEKWLCEIHFGKPVFVYDYPRECKSFYMRVNDSPDKTEPGETVACFDLLVPGIGELIGGSVREERTERLKEVISQGSSLEWYLDLRKYGGLPTGGFGMGFERIMSWITGIENIKDCIPAPRTSGRLLM
ncbi:hypothetical protein DL96DRAFT_1816382 [Flagelloscypha sp. PMI_526]|nr:hypothetical protein DL96DRAFT_1816382 [Flagelloscypha sp. PMI_526]